MANTAKAGSTAEPRRNGKKESGEAPGSDRPREARVPRIIHQFWDRPDPPADVVERMRTWQAMHPGWAYIRWSDESAYTTILANWGKKEAHLYLSCTIPAMRADILRIGALMLFGGVYADADMRCLRSVEPLTAARCMVQVRERTDAPPERVLNGLLIAEPNHILFRNAWSDMMANIRESGRAKIKQLRANPLNDVRNVTGPVMLAKAYNALSDKQRAEINVIDFDVRQVYVEGAKKLSYVREAGNWEKQMARQRIVDLDAGRRLAAERTAGTPAD